MRKFLTSIAILLPVIVVAQQYSIDWFVIAGGGDKSTGGNYSLTGTIAQLDSSEASNGDNRGFAGGFWAVQSPGAPTVSLAPADAGQITISWSPPMPGWTLQETTDLSAGLWTNSPSGTTTPITVPAIGKKFFRLAKP